MNHKIIWKRIYELIKYENYNIIPSYSNEEDVWLFHHQTQKLKRIIFTKETSQSLNFIVDKMQDSLLSIESNIGHSIKFIELIIIENDVIANYNIENISVKVLNNTSQMNQILHHKFQSITKLLKPQSRAFYKRRIFNTQLVDNAITKFSPVTTALILINIIVFIVLLFKPALNQTELLLENGALTHFNFVHGDYFRILTSMFVHLDFSHLLLNMMSLFIFGKIIEYLFGSLKYITIYLMGGMIGNLLSLTFDNFSISAGASGGICALTGAFIVYLIFSKMYQPKFIIQMLFVFILFMLLSNLYQNVNNYAHFGGFFGGIFIAVLLNLYKIKRNYFWYVLIVFVLTIIMMLLNIFAQKENHIYNEMALSAFESGNTDTANRIIKKIIKHGYENDETYQIYGLMQSNELGIDEAINVWKKGIKRYPNSPILNYQLALAYRSIDKYDTANQYIDKAVKLSNEKKYKQLQEEIKTFR